MSKWFKTQHEKQGLWWGNFFQFFNKSFVLDLAVYRRLLPLCLRFDFPPDPVNCWQIFSMQLSCFTVCNTTHRALESRGISHSILAGALAEEAALMQCCNWASATLTAQRVFLESPASYVWPRDDQSGNSLIKPCREKALWCFPLLTEQ